MISALLAAGAKLDLLTAVNSGRLAEAEALVRADPSRIGPDGADTIALHLAVSKLNLGTIRWLLAHGIAVSAKRSMWDCNHTALHMTTENGAIEIAWLLLDAGADPNVRDDKFHATALGWADSSTARISPTLSARRVASGSSPAELRLRLGPRARARPPSSWLGRMLACPEPRRGPGRPTSERQGQNRSGTRWGSTRVPDYAGAWEVVAPRLSR